MQISPSEIDTMEEIGNLNGSPVKLIRTKGGFWICLGRKPNRDRDEAIAAGSHPAIVKYNLQKQYPEFQPSMRKSETFQDASVVEKHSHFLSVPQRDAGYDVYSVQTKNKIEFQITKIQSRVHSVEATLVKSELIFKDITVSKDFARALAGATAEKAQSCGITKMRIVK